jgi:hypothetical protein
VWAIERRELNLALARPGARVTLALRRNPANEHDPNAIEVCLQPPLLTLRPMLGHLPRDVARRLAPELDEKGDNSWAAEVEKIVVNDAHPDRPGLRILAWRRADGYPTKETYEREAPPVPRDWGYYD